MSSRCVDVVCAYATEVMDNEQAALFTHPKPQSWRNQGGVQTEAKQQTHGGIELE